MMMYHSVQSQRYARAKGMKVKHLVQLVVLTVLFTWFLYQLNSSHKAKVISRRAEKEGDIDDELLISADSENLTRYEAVDTAELAQEEFIDKKSVESALKSRRMGPPDMLELEQTMAEGDRVEDVLDDSGEGDRDDRVKSDDQVRRAEGTKVKKGRKDRKGRHTGVTETAEDRGDGEDEMAETILAKEFGGSEGWTSTKLTETVEDDTLIYTSDDSKVKGADVSEEKTLTNARKANADANADADADEKRELAASVLPDKRQAVKISKDGKNFTKLDDGEIDHLALSNETKTGSATVEFLEEKDAEKNLRISEMITPASAAQSAKSTSKFDIFDEGASIKSNVAGSTISRSRREFNEEMVDGSVSLQNGAEAKAVPGRGARDEHDNEAILGDGHDSVQQDPIVKSVSEDQPVQPGTIAEVVSVVKQDKTTREEAIPDVVTLAKQERADGE